MIKYQGSNDSENFKAKLELWAMVSQSSQEEQEESLKEM